MVPPSLDLGEEYIVMRNVWTSLILIFLLCSLLQLFVTNVENFPSIIRMFALCNGYSRQALWTCDRWSRSVCTIVSKTYSWTTWHRTWSMKMLTHKVLLLNDGERCFYFLFAELDDCNGNVFFTKVLLLQQYKWLQFRMSTTNCRLDIPALYLMHSELLLK